MGNSARGISRRLADAASVFKPNVASLGYALFLAVNATGVWGGVFPFLPLHFQTPQILFWFFLAQSVTFFASFVASGLGAYFLPGPTKRLSVVLAGAPYLVGWCCLIAAIYLDAAALPLVVAGGAFLGLGSAGFYMLWQRLFASCDADRGINPVFIYGFFGSIVYALHDLGFFGGTFVERLDVFGASGITLLALTAVYLLGLMYFVGQGGLRRVLGFDEHDTSIELVALRPAGEPLPAPKDVRKPHADEAPAPASPETAPIDEPSYQDRLSKQIALVQRYYRLSARETEVMELIARGNTVARIAEMLVVSENTIRTHSKRIYAKLDVHKRQELRDLIDSLDPRELD